MRNRVIREAILEAHQNHEKYGNTWYVLDSDGFDVVKESYFIDEDGTRKAKPFISLYNTEDKFYGNHGMGHAVEYVDGDLKFTSSWDDPKWDDFEQPYGDRIEEKEVGIRPMGVVGRPIGIAGHGSSIVMANLISRIGHSEIVKLKDMVSMHDELEDNHDGIQKLFVVDNIDKLLHYDIPVSIREERFDMKTGKMVEDKYQRPMSDAKRKQLRNKRKKRN
jgi:hypothetical protein